jgi:outer membrane protein
MAIFSFSENWHLGAGAIYSRLLSDAADSPVTSKRGSKNQIFAGIGVAYAW